MPKDGDTRRLKQGRTGWKYQVYRDPPGEWRTTTGEDRKKARDAFLDQNGGSTAFKQIDSPGINSTSLRYPSNAAYAPGSDYVLFEFYEYVPPFQNINAGNTQNNSKPLAAYNQSATDSAFYDKTSEKSIILYMPEDVSTGYKANWSGKAFSNIGAQVLKTAGSGDLGQGAQNLLDLGGKLGDAVLAQAGRVLVQETISKLTGENIDDNDIYGSTRGVILNPNVELLFSGTDLRNFQLNYKLVPRNDTEANNITEIIKIFKRSMLPRFSDGKELNLVGGKNVANSFIKVPNFCRVSFMRGGGLNTDVTQYKMCAITQVDINYTPDGAYATYEDGKMVAIELSLAFQESKLIFAEEADKY